VAQLHSPSCSRSAPLLCSSGTCGRLRAITTMRLCDWPQRLQPTVQVLPMLSRLSQLRLRRLSHRGAMTTA